MAPRGCSPAPIEILGAPVIAILADVVGTVSVRGGIPVVDRSQGGLAGVEIVIDKDRASALLAFSLNAEMLLLLTDVDAVYTDFGRPDAKRIHWLDAASIDKNTFDLRSMLP